VRGLPARVRRVGAEGRVACLLKCVGWLHRGCLMCRGPLDVLRICRGAAVHVCICKCVPHKHGSMHAPSHACSLNLVLQHAAWLHPQVLCTRIVKNACKVPKWQSTTCFVCTRVHDFPSTCLK